MTLFNTSAESETRVLSRIGVFFVSFVVIAALLYLVVNPFGRGQPRNVISVAIETPYVGQGVAAGTPVIMHGVKIGQVVRVASMPGGGVRLQTDLQSQPTRELTDTIGIDYRPSNYFGVTGINVIPGQSGRPLRNGMKLSVTPKGNFSLQALLYRLGELSNGVFNQQLVRVIERATRYVDGLTPLLETVLIVGNSVAKVQNVSSARLLTNATGISVTFPGIVDALISTGNDFLHTGFVDKYNDVKEFEKNWRYWPTYPDDVKKRFEDNFKFEKQAGNGDDYFKNHFFPLLDTARLDVFSRVGYLEGSIIGSLFPVLESVRTLLDTVPKIVSPENFAYTVTELRTRLERMYAGSGDQRALQVRIVLDRLPGVAAPLPLVLGGSPTEMAGSS